MTLASEVVKKQYDGDDSTVAFPTTFVFWDNTEIEVILLVVATGVETPWVEDTHYTLTGGDGATGTVTVETAPTDYTPATGERLTIRSILPDTQESVMPLGGPFPSTVVEKRLDKNVRLTQQRSEEISRTLKMSKSSTVTDPTLPEPSAGKAVKWKDDLSGLENTDSDLDDVEAAAAASAAAAGTSETNAAASESAASTSESNSATSESNAADSAAAAAATVSSYMGTLQPKVVNIGDWNMDGTTSVDVAHGLDHSKIRKVSALIRKDDAQSNHPSPLDMVASATDTTPQGGIGQSSTTTHIRLYRLTGGLFDHTNYNETTFNRGWVLIWHVD